MAKKGIKTDKDFYKLIWIYTEIHSFPQFTKDLQTNCPESFKEIKPKPDFSNVSSISSKALAEC